LIEFNDNNDNNDSNDNNNDNNNNNNNNNKMTNVIIRMPEMEKEYMGGMYSILRVFTLFLTLIYIRNYASW
jgi:hypothetical protein